MFKHAIPGCKLAQVSLVNKQAHSQIIAEDTLITKLATDRVIAPQWHPYHTQPKVSAPKYEQWIDAAALDHGAAWSCPALGTTLLLRSTRETRPASSCGVAKRIQEQSPASKNKSPKM